MDVSAKKAALTGWEDIMAQWPYSVSVEFDEREAVEKRAEAEQHDEDGVVAGLARTLDLAGLGEGEMVRLFVHGIIQADGPARAR